MPLGQQEYLIVKDIILLIYNGILKLNQISMDGWLKKL